MLRLLLLALLCLAPALASAQATIPQIPPTGASYTIRFTSPATTAQVCAFAVTAPAGTPIGTDRLPPPGFDKADALACTNAVVADGTTVNTITFTLTPAPTGDVLVALIGYPAATDPRPASAFSNLGNLVVAVRPSTIVP